MKTLRLHPLAPAGGIYRRCWFYTFLHSEAQIYDPVQWRLELDVAEAPPNSTVLARLTATIEDGWHVYSTTSPAGNRFGSPDRRSRNTIKEWRAYQPEPQLVYDPNFEAEVEWYTNEAVFLFELDLTARDRGRIPDRGANTLRRL